MNAESKNLQRVQSFGGLNKTNGAEANEYIDCTNLSTESYPALSSREPREEIGTGTDIYEVDGNLVRTDGNDLYWNDTLIGGVKEGRKQFALINTKLCIWPDAIYININTHEVFPMAAKVTSNAQITDGETMTLSGDVTEYGEQFVNAGYVTLYKDLAWVDGKWSYSDRIIINTATKTLTVGWYFIGMQILTSNSQNYTPTTYTQYGKITAATLTDSENQFYTYSYEMYDHSKGAGLTGIFEAGDGVSITGSTLYANNKENVIIESVRDSALKFQEDSFIPVARYQNLTADLAAGTYLFTVTAAASVGTYVKTQKKATVSRTLRAGEQIYYIQTGTTTSTTQWGTETLKTYTFYVYDPELKTFEEIPSTAISGSTSGLTEFTIEGVYEGTAESLTVERKIPKMDYICEHNNRLYGVSNSETGKVYNALTKKYETASSRTIFASALGYPTRFYSYEGLSTDSYAVSVSGSGDFTGIAEYSSSVLAFKEDMMYRLTGDYPAEYYLRNYKVDGVKKGAGLSIVTINEVLYYLGLRGVMRYAGSTPSLVSYNLGLEKYEFGAAGRDRMRYLISLKGDTQKTYCYDTIHGLWSCWDEEEATSIVRSGEDAKICAGGKIYKTGSGTETVTWSALFAQTNESTFYKKRIRYVRLDADVQGTLKLEYKANDNDWQELGTIENKTGRKIHAFPVDAKREDRMQLRISGTGELILYAIEWEYVAGSEK